MPTVAATALSDYIARVFAATGSPEDEARRVAEHLVGANLRGHDSHGVIRAPSYVANAASGMLKPDGPAMDLMPLTSLSPIVRRGGRLTFAPRVSRRHCLSAWCWHALPCLRRGPLTGPSSCSTKSPRISTKRVGARSLTRSNPWTSSHG